MSSLFTFPTHNHIVIAYWPLRKQKEDDKEIIAVIALIAKGNTSNKLSLN